MMSAKRGSSPTVMEGFPLPDAHQMLTNPGRYRSRLCICDPSRLVVRSVMLAGC
jgi:hypothetical protein